MNTRSDKAAEIARKQVKERGGGGDNAGLEETLVVAVVANALQNKGQPLQARSNESRVVQETLLA